MSFGVDVIGEKYLKTPEGVKDFCEVAGVNDFCKVP